MASAIFFLGRRINIPGAYSQIDASALSPTSPAAVGIVALVGTAEGGKPKTVEESESDCTTPEKIKTRFRSGNLRIGGTFCFDPSAEQDGQGPVKTVAVKVNAAAQSSLTLPDGTPVNSVTLTSKDYGLFTTQINVAVAAGTTKGKKITIKFEDVIETFDDVGGDNIFTVQYTPGSNGYGT